MQLIFEKESTIDITSNMSTLEDVLDKKIILNGIIENIVQDVNMGNKENINKPLNVIDEQHQNQKMNSVSCIEEESLANSLVHINKIEIEESGMEMCNRNESVVKLPETLIKNENEEDLTIEKYIENNPELKLEATEENEDIHDNITDEQQNVSVSMDNNCEDNEKEMPLNNIDNNPEEQLVQIKKEINDILKKEILNLDELETSAQSEVEGNREIQKCSTDDDCQLYIQNEALQDSTVEQETEDIVNVVTDTKNVVLFNEPLLETNINMKVDEIIDNKLTQILQSTAEENISEKKDCDEEIENIASNLTENVADADIENDCTVRNISNDNEFKASTDAETVDVRDYENNDDSTDCKLEAMDVEVIEEDCDNNKNLHEGTDVDKEVHTKSSESDIENLDDSSSSNNAIDCDEVTEVIDKEATQDLGTLNSKDEVMLIDEDKDLRVTNILNNEQALTEKDCEKSPSRKSPICRLSNTLDILSDDDDDPSESSPEIDPSKELETDSTNILETGKQAINIEDDDDIVVIDEDVGNKTEIDSGKEECSRGDILPQKEQLDADMEVAENKSNFMESIELSSVKNSKESTSHIPNAVDKVIEAKDNSEINEQITETAESKKPLIADGFLNTTKKRLADMTREELEEFCVLKIVESIVDRSNLSEIKLKLKSMAQSFEEYSKKTMVLYKQNRDLQVVLKSIQEEQKKAPNAITPLKITRSVGMQVLMIEKTIRKKGSASTSQANHKTRSSSNQGARLQNLRSSANNNIPVPRLIPASNAVIAKGSTSQNSPNNVAKQVIPVTNGLRTSLPAQKLPEKRPLNKSQSTDCVDLTDDEPPTKMVSRSPTTPVRLVPPQNLLAPQRGQFGQAVNSPRKVYIPISSPQGSNMRPGQTFMVKAAGPRSRGPAPILPRMSQNQMRPNRLAQSQANRHPAPLPDAMKQYQPPNWKALPPAPDLKLSKVENGIVISWKIEGYQEDSYEDIASYQLYAYQETSSPPSTALWKKIGDVKALPLPMACTLTQFMSGFKYYFAVRAVDVRSRLGPFSLPGSILLLNKM